MTERPDWVRAVQLLGEYAGNLVPVAVDQYGNLYALLQGEYQGQLRTVKLDSEGRISAFVIDSVDAWNRMLTIGNAELAVRLGSLVSYDRRGSVLWYDDFHNGLAQWNRNLVGTGTSATVVPRPSAHGGYSIYTYVPTTGTYVNLVTYIPLFPATRYGLLASVSAQTESVVITVDLRVNTPSTQIRAALRWNFYTHEVQVLNSTNTWQTIDSIGGFADPILWYPMKVVVDISAMRYVRALVAGYEIDISSITPYSETPLLPPTLMPQLWFETHVSDVSAHSYLDYIVVTAAEP